MDETDRPATPSGLPDDRMNPAAGEALPAAAAPIGAQRTGPSLYPPYQRPPRSKWRSRIIWTSRGLAVFIALFMAVVAWLAVTAPLSRSLKPIAPPSITLLSADGQLIARKGAVIDKPVAVKNLPEHVPQAFLAIEDRRFYDHWGVDPRGIARAMWHNMRAHGMREGGSTITQQLAKGVFLSSDRTFGRKAREALIALWLEAWLSKDEILERYLSNVYFGDNVYGLRAASLHYFSREPEKLTVPQAALLAGLLKAPSRLAPTGNLAGAQARAKLVMDAMLDAKFITVQERRVMRPAQLDVRDIRQPTSGTYFADWVLPGARDRAGAVYGEQRVTTTLDSHLQHLAEGAARRAGLGEAQVAILSMRPTGEVVAMIGGKDYEKSPYNRVTQARRQPGSTFKLFVYLAAIREGMSPDDMVDDTPITEGDYRPGNHDGKYRGRITLRQAFAVSSNVAAVRLAEKVGIDKVIRTARDLGIKSPLADNASIALGTSEVSMLELASAYAAIAANAYPIEAHGLPPEEQSWVTRLINRKHSFDERTLDALRDLLRTAANRGTGRSAALRTPTFGKTGTSQNNRDAIFVGYAGGLVTAVWVGRDDNQPVPGIAGGGLPARIWRDYMSRAVESGALEEAARTQANAENAAANVDISADIANLSFGVKSQGLSINVTLPQGGEDQAPPVSVPPPPPPSSSPPRRAPDEEGPAQPQP